MSEIYAYLRAHQDEMLRQVEWLVRQDSPSNDKELVDKCGRQLCEIIRNTLNVETQSINQKKVGNHVMFKVGRGPTKILLLGHFDTVWDPGVLRYRIEGNKAYGPGIFDMKAGIVQGIWAVKALRECSQSLSTEVTFLLTTDEEVGSGTSRSIIEEKARQADAVFVLEPSVGKTGAIKTARKGTFLYNITAHGVSAHAGNHPEDGASAIHELSRQVSRIVDSIPNHVYGTTVNVGTIRGGMRSNVVADTAHIEVDVRVSDLSEVPRIEQFFNGLSPHDVRIKFVIAGGLNRPPLEKTEQSQRLYKMAKQIASQELGFELEEASVGGGSDGNFTSALGIPTLDGLGAVGDGPHAEHEHILIDGLSQRSALLAYLLMA